MGDKLMMEGEKKPDINFFYRTKVIRQKNFVMIYSDLYSKGWFRFAVNYTYPRWPLHTYYVRSCGALLVRIVLNEHGASVCCNTSVHSGRRYSTMFHCVPNVINKLTKQCVLAYLYTIIDRH